MLLPGPLVSVIIPAYNAELFIAETLNSVLTQTYQNLEILVVDDGSSDSTQDIIQAYMNIDDRIILIKQSNAGVAAARNQAIEQAKGEFIAPIDADDIWFPEYIEAQISLMFEPEVGMVYAWSVFIDESGQLMKTCQSNLWQGSDYLPLIYRNLPGNASCVLLRRSHVQSIGMYDSSYHTLNAQGSEDWDLYLRLAERSEVRVVPRLLVGYRQVSGSMSMNVEQMRRSVDLVLDRFAQYHPEINPIIYQWSRSNFSWYLALKSNRIGDHLEAITQMTRALKLDYFLLFRLNFYRLGLSSFLRILFYPITSMIWTNHQAWIVFKKRLDVTLRSVNPFRKNISLEILERRQLAAKRHFPRCQYEQFLTWRFSRIYKQVDKNLYASQCISKLDKKSDLENSRE